MEIISNNCEDKSKIIQFRMHTRKKQIKRKQYNVKFER